MDLSAFETWMRSWGASESTIRERLSVLSVGMGEWGDPLMVTAEALGAWLASPRYSPWSRTTYFYHLKSLFGWLKETGRIQTNPVDGMRPPRAPKDRPRPLTPEEVTAALAAAHGNQRTWLLLGLLAGLRAFEIAKVQGQDVNERTLFVIGKGQVQAYLPTHPTLWEVAQDYPRAGYWFPSRGGSKRPHVAGTSVSTMTTRLFKPLGIEGSIHRCRHTFATTLLRSGVNVRVAQTLMRHQSLATIAKYTAVDEEERMAAVVGLSV